MTIQNQQPATVSVNSFCRGNEVIVTRDNSLVIPSSLLPEVFCGQERVVSMSLSDDMDDITVVLSLDGENSSIKPREETVTKTIVAGSLSDDTFAREDREVVEQFVEVDIPRGLIPSQCYGDDSGNGSGRVFVVGASSPDERQVHLTLVTDHRLQKQLEANLKDLPKNLNELSFPNMLSD